MSKAKVLFSDTEMVSVDDLERYPGNARKGDVKLIAQSLAENQQYRPIVVQRSTSYVLAGNHTLLAAKMLGWDEVAVVWVDVDDGEAKKIVLADNKTNDVASYDNKALLELLEEVPSLVGTGFSRGEYDSLLELYGQAASAAVEGAASTAAFDGAIAASEMPVGSAFAGDDLPDIKASDILGEKSGEPDPFEDADDIMPGVIAIDSDRIFERGKTKFDIPPLRGDMLWVPDKPLRTWAKEGANPPEEEHDQYIFVWNYGLVSTKTLPDLSGVVLAFFTDDHKFDGWWDDPSYFFTKLFNMNPRVQGAITPDFTTYDDEPLIFNLLSVYKSFWLGRYMQEIGIPVMPRVITIGHDDVFVAQLSAIPASITDVMISWQNLNFKEAGIEKVLDAIKARVKLMEETLPNLRRIHVLAGPPSIKWCGEIAGEFRSALVPHKSYSTICREAGKWFGGKEGADEDKSASPL